MMVGVLTGMLAGCAVSGGGGDPEPGSGGGGGAGGSGGSAGGPTGGPGGGGVGGGGGGVGGGGGSGGGNPGGKSCGGFTGAQCAADEYCNYFDDKCGAADGQGSCEKRPDACPEFYKPTCACDGKVYGNLCEAAAMGSDVSGFGGCKPPTVGLFGCGSGFCDVKTEYCMHTPADVPDTPDSNTCAPLPAACGSAPSCACIPSSCGGPLPGTCDKTADGGLRLTCPGG